MPGNKCLGHINRMKKIFLVKKIWVEESLKVYTGNYESGFNFLELHTAPDPAMAISL